MGVGGGATAAAAEGGVVWVCPGPRTRMRSKLEQRTAHATRPALDECSDIQHVPYCGRYVPKRQRPPSAAHRALHAPSSASMVLLTSGFVAHT